MELMGQVALVTGASRGIGRSIALQLASAGAAVAVNYLSQAEAAEAVVAEITARGGRAFAWQADVADAAACAAMVGQTVARYGRIDILINNAGNWSQNLLADTSVEEWDRFMAIHLRGVYACSRAALKHMVPQGHGRIVTISSIWGMTGAAMEVPYSAAKAGQIGFTKALAQEVGPAGITVNAVAPGAIQTDMNEVLEPGPALQEWLARTPVRRLGTPDEIGAVVRFLVGPQAGFITGQVISPNGGVVV